MDKNQFWAIIERSCEESHGRSEDQLAAVRRQLEALSPEDIAAFHSRFDECVAEAHRSELRSAAYVINGDCSDEGFEYFRNWLISKGRKVYEAALRDPETLSEVAADPDDCQFEEIGYVATQVWERKTGKDLSRFPFPDLERPDSPSGEDWSEDSDELERRFPKLWKRFAS